MKKMSNVFGIIILTICFSTQTFAVKTLITPEVEKSAIETYLDQNDVSAKDFLKLKTKTIRKETNKKLSFKEKVYFKLVKFEIANKMRKDADFDAEAFYKVGAGSFNIGGFLLGFFLPIIGNLIALLFGGNAFKWSLIGTLTSVIAGLIAWIL